MWIGHCRRKDDFLLSTVVFVRPDSGCRLLFPQIHILLQLLLTLPLTSATAERSFSTLRRLKSYLRSTIGQSRLNGLAQMSINRDLPIDAEDVLNELVKKKRRLNFLL